MKKIFFISILLATAVYSLRAQTNIGVGAWNIQWLGNPDRRTGCAKDFRQTAEDIALYVESSRVDILALEEIGDTDGNSQTRGNSILDRTMTLLNARPGNRWTYLLFPKKNLNDTTQLTGVAWNQESVARVGDPFRIQLNIPTGGINYWDRWATAVKFKFGTNRTDIVVIPLHLKANVGSGNHVLQRDGEARFLVDQLGAIRSRFSDNDLLLIGDTNIVRRTESAVARFQNAGFRDLNDTDRSTVVDGAAPFDRAFVVSNQPEFSISQMDVFALNDVSKSEFRAKFSDHLMIRFVVRNLADDD